MILGAYPLGAYPLGALPLNAGSAGHAVGTSTAQASGSFSIALPRVDVWGIGGWRWEIVSPSGRKRRIVRRTQGRAQGTSTCHAVSSYRVAADVNASGRAVANCVSGWRISVSGCSIGSAVVTGDGSVRVAGLGAIVGQSTCGATGVAVPTGAIDIDNEFLLQQHDLDPVDMDNDLLMVA